MWKRSSLFSKVARGTAALMAVFLIAMAVPMLFVQAQSQAALKSAHSPVQVASAGGWEIDILCGGPEWLGRGMGRGHAWDSGAFPYILPNAQRHRWSLQEAYGSQLTFPVYYGEGGRGKIFIYDTDPDAKEDQNGRDTRLYKGIKNQLGLSEEDADKLYGKIKPEAELIRDWTTCTITTGLVGVSSSILNLSNLVVVAVQRITNFAFNPNFICVDPNTPSDASCFNLYTVSYGENKDGNENSVFGRLVAFFTVIAPIFSLIYVVYKSLTLYPGRRYREILTSFLKVLGITGLGFAIFAKPDFFMTALPQSAQSSASLFLSTITGTKYSFGNTDDGASNDGVAGDGDSIFRANTELKPNDTIENACAIDLSYPESTDLVATAQGLSINFSQMGCTMWRAFVLEPMVISSFGMPSRELDTKVPGTYAYNLINGLNKDGSTRDDEIKVDGNLFCVPLSSPGKTVNSFAGSQIDLSSGHQICNIAAYQMYLQTDNAAIDPHDPPENNEFYRIIGVMGMDQTLWGNWNPGSSQSQGRLQIAAASLITSMLAGWGFLVFGFIGMLYYLMLSLYPVLAPLAFTFAILTPLLFRKYFITMGTLFLCYIVSAVVFGVMGLLYDAILGSTSSTSIHFILVLLINFALLRYRKNIFELFNYASYVSHSVMSKTPAMVSDKLDQIRAKGIRKGKDQAYAAKRQGAAMMTGIGSGARKIRQGVKTRANAKAKAAEQLMNSTTGDDVLDTTTGTPGTSDSTTGAGGGNGKKSTRQQAPGTGKRVLKDGSPIPHMEGEEMVTIDPETGQVLHLNKTMPGGSAEGGTGVPGDGDAASTIDPNAAPSRKQRMRGGDPKTYTRGGAGQQDDALGEHGSHDPTGSGHIPSRPDDVHMRQSVVDPETGKLVELSDQPPVQQQSSDSLMIVDPETGQLVEVAAATGAGAGVASIGQQMQADIAEASKAAEKLEAETQERERKRDMAERERERKRRQERTGADLLEQKKKRDAEKGMAEGEAPASGEGSSDGGTNTSPQHGDHGQQDQTSTPNVPEGSSEQSVKPQSQGDRPSRFEPTGETPGPGPLIRQAVREPQTAEGKARLAEAMQEPGARSYERVDNARTERVNNLVRNTSQAAKGFLKGTPSGLADDAAYHLREIQQYVGRMHNASKSEVVDLRNGIKAHEHELQAMFKGSARANEINTMMNGIYKQIKDIDT